MKKIDIALQALKRRKTISSGEMQKLTNSNNQADLIYQLRRKGHDITTYKRVRNGVTFAVYSLEVAA